MNQLPTNVKLTLARKAPASRKNKGKQICDDEQAGSDKHKDETPENYLASLIISVTDKQSNKVMIVYLVTRLPLVAQCPSLNRTSACLFSLLIFLSMPFVLLSVDSIVTSYEA